MGVRIGSLAGIRRPDRIQETDERLSKRTLVDRISDFSIKLTGIKHRVVASDTEIMHHLGGIHLTPAQFYSYGIPCYDIDLAKYRGILLDGVVDSIYQRLENPERYGFDEHQPITVSEYRTYLVKTLKYIEKRKVGTVDWKRVENTVSGASQIQINLTSDFREEYFNLGLKWKVKDFFDSWR